MRISSVINCSVVFVDPYLYWIQHQDVKGVRKFALSLRQELNKKAVTLKDDLELDLAIYERLVMGEEESGQRGFIILSFTWEVYVRKWRTGWRNC